MKISTIILLSLSLIACSTEYRTVQEIRIICNDSTVEKRASFTLQCINNANPKSDEEPEDWIKQCQTMAEGIYCDKTPVVVEEMKPAGSYWRDIKVTPAKQ